MPEGYSRKRRRKRRREALPKRYAIAGVGALSAVVAVLVALALTQQGPSAAEEAAIAQRAEAARAAYAEEQARLAAEEAAAEAAAAEARKPRVIPPSDGPLTVLYVGDSLTYGAFASVEEAAFRPLVTEALRAQMPVEETWVGGSGATTLDVTPKIPTTSFDLVIVEMTTNDATNLPEEDLEANYTALIAAVRAASPNAALVCTGSWQTEWRVSQTDPEVSSICEANGGAYVKLGDFWLDESMRGPDLRETEFGIADNFHPNDAGHRAIADAILASIRIG